MTKRRMTTITRSTRVRDDNKKFRRHHQNDKGENYGINHTRQYHSGNKSRMNNPKYEQEDDNGRISDRARLLAKVKKATKGGE